MKNGIVEEWDKQSGNMLVHNSSEFLVYQIALQIVSTMNGCRVSLSTVQCVQLCAIQLWLQHIILSNVTDLNYRTQTARQLGGIEK
jgi:hypothetical protein